MLFLPDQFNLVQFLCFSHLFLLNLIIYFLFIYSSLILVINYSFLLLLSFSSILPNVAFYFCALFPFLFFSIACVQANFSLFFIFQLFTQKGMYKYFHASCPGVQSPPHEKEQGAYALCPFPLLYYLGLINEKEIQCYYSLTSTPSAS